MMRIAIQGTKASFHHQAAMKFFSDDFEIVECDSFEEVCRTKASGDSDLAILAIENTLAGSFLPNYTLLQKYKLRIIGEVYLHIEQNLLGLPGTTLEDIRFVRSHPMALLQCSEYLYTKKNMVAIESSDTAGSAREIARYKLTDTAAIAGQLAADTFGLQVLERGIENIRENHTRFMVLDGTTDLDLKPDKASISYTVRHNVGCLADTLAVFKDHEINLTKIQSVPIIGQPYEYQFHADLEWKDDNKYRQALKALDRYVDSIDILGEYERGEKTIYYSDSDKIERL